MRTGKWVKAVLAAAAFQAAPAAADEVPTVTWECWYLKESVSVGCRLAQAPDATTGATSRMPPNSVAHRIRSQPASLSAELVVIPLYSPTEDMARTARLARAVMCGTQAACTVDFIPPPSS